MLVSPEQFDVSPVAYEYFLHARYSTNPHPPLSSERVSIPQRTGQPLKTEKKGDATFPPKKFKPAGPDSPKTLFFSPRRLFRIPIWAQTGVV
jgi:hypothetical protein